MPTFAKSLAIHRVRAMTPPLAAAYAGPYRLLTFSGVSSGLEKTPPKMPKIEVTLIHPYSSHCLNKNPI